MTRLERWACLTACFAKDGSRALAKASAALAVIAALLPACSVLESARSRGAGAEQDVHRSFAELPLIAGWHEGRRVHYITTDASDKAMARKLGANYAPRLSAALPPAVKAPGQQTALERIYGVTNFAQGNVLASAPSPAGFASLDKAYSPLWLVHEVTWQPGRARRELRSEEEILDAVEKKWVSINPTGIVVNCPVVLSDRGGLLHGVKPTGVLP